MSTQPLRSRVTCAVVVTIGMALGVAQAQDGRRQERGRAAEQRQRRPAAEAKSPRFHVLVGAIGVARGQETYLLQTPSGNKIELKTADVLSVKRTEPSKQEQPAHAVVVLASAVQPGRERGQQAVTTMSGQLVSLAAQDLLEVIEQKPATAAAQAQQPTEQQKEAARKEPRFSRPARELKPSIRQRPPLSIAKLPAAVEVEQGGAAKAVALEGAGLERVTSAQVMRDGKVVSGATVALSAARKDGARTVSVLASEDLPPGQYEIRFLTAAGAAAQQTLRLDVKASNLVLREAPLKLVAIDRGRIRLPGRGTPTKDPVTMFEVWRGSGGQRWSQQVRGARQLFIANGTHLETAELMLGGSGDVRVRVWESVEDAPLLADQTVGITQSSTTITFDPPVALTPGSLYAIQVDRAGGNGTFTAYGSNVATDHVWARARTKLPDQNFANAPGPNLNLKLRGYWENMPAAVKNPTRPNKKALLILLENGGIQLDDVGGLEDAVPDITIASCGNFTLELAPGESVFDKLGDAIYNFVHCLDPGNWSFDQMSFADWWAPVSDYVMELINNSVSDVIAGTTPKKYDKVVRLHQGNFKRDRVMQELQTLAPEYVVDIHLLCHGGTDCVVGDDNEFFTVANFFLPLRQKMTAGQIPLHLRGIYQMNCSSGTLVDEWQALGAKVVNGTEGAKLNCMPTQYHHFLTHWLNGKKFSESITNSFNEAKPYWNVVWVLEPQNVTDSKHFTHGNGNTTMDSQ